ncbi:DNA-directed RNA polymerase subunit beta' [Porphyrobacter sp. AAP60]|uniref:DNA-directed RNA polymerase subunit beta' n=1 Tax=Porphyrobacter sp. AAP60 TaxID=1523423 RepID=UPI001F44DB2A|nr:DNA-directed RNA polymerase subunit beta' [Porphyrobacter sp. AAP60]
MPLAQQKRGFMPQHRPSSATTRNIIAALAVPPRIETLGPVAGRFLHALRLIALHERMGRDPVPELAIRLGSVAIAAKALILAQTISAAWPENIHVSRFCCRLLSHDEATIGAFIDAAFHGNRAGFEDALAGLIRPERMHRLWEGALALTAAELRAA